MVEYFDIPAFSISALVLSSIPLLQKKFDSRSFWTYPGHHLENCCLDFANHSLWLDHNYFATSSKLYGHNDLTARDFACNMLQDAWIPENFSHSQLLKLLLRDHNKLFISIIIKYYFFFLKKKHYFSIKLWGFRLANVTNLNKCHPNLHHDQ